MTEASLQIPVEQIFDRIKALCESRQYAAALSLIEILEQYRSGKEVVKEPSEGLLLSYKGLCVSRGKRHRAAGLELCLKAAQTEFFQPAVYLNLGRVYLDMGKRREAHAAFEKGLAINAQFAPIQREISRMGRRRPPVFSFLPRGHFLNRFFGKLRSGNRHT